MRTRSAEGVEDDIPTAGDGWLKTRIFGRAALLRRLPDGELLIALRISSIPIGVPFRSLGTWGAIVVEAEDGDDAASRL